MEQFKFYIQAGEGHQISIQGKELKHNDKPLLLDVEYVVNDGILSFVVPDSDGVRIAIGVETLQSVTITKSVSQTYVLGNYADNSIRVANCCATNCNYTACGLHAWVKCPDGSEVCC